MNAGSTESVAVVMMDHQGHLIDINDEAERLFGFVRADVLDRMVADVLVPQRLRMQHMSGLTRYINSGYGPVIGKRIEIPALNARGEEIMVELLIARVDGTDPPVFQAQVRLLNKLA